MNIKQFQEDLNNGMSIEDCCIKHHVTLDYAFKVLQKWERRKILQKNTKERKQ